MPVNAHEKVQIGHYCLLKGDPAAAERWYGAACDELPAPEPVPWSEFLSTSGSLRRNFTFFHAYCLRQVGKEHAARDKVAEFRETYRPLQAAEGPQAAAAGEASRPAPDDSANRELLVRLMQDLYIAQVFLSLNSREEGQTFFEDSLKAAQTPGERLSSAVALSQLLLLDEQFEPYFELATNTLAPLWAQLASDNWLKWRPERALSVGTGAAPLPLIAEFSLLPLHAKNFVGELEGQHLENSRPKWETLRQSSSSNLARLLIDLFLAEGFSRFGTESDWRNVAEQISRNPVRGELLPPAGPAQLVSELHNWVK